MESENTNNGLLNSLKFSKMPCRLHNFCNPTAAPSFHPLKESINQYLWRPNGPNISFSGAAY